MVSTILFSGCAAEVNLQQPSRYKGIADSENDPNLWVMKRNVLFKSAPASGAIFYVPISPTSQKVWQHTFVELPLEAVLLKAKK